jgi:hypothetical protein
LAPLESQQQEEFFVNHRFAALGLVAAGLVAGGAAGVVLGIPGVSGAQTTTTPSSGASADTSNHDPAHEAAETPEQAAAEASGNFHGGGGHSNTDPAHEAAESPERAAAEAAHDATVTSPTTPGTVH